MNPPGQFVYIHVPFCEQRCAYCDFFTITDAERTNPLAPRWLDIVAREMQLWRAAGDLSESEPIQTLYFGGGTPSLTEPEAMARFIAYIRDNFTISPDVEITVEMQPATADAEKLEKYAAAGVNRFSVGVQTFDDELLNRTGRRHTVQQARDLLLHAKAIGTCSLDLIAALPGQDLEMWQREIDQALVLDVPHISVYELTYHAGTRFQRELKQQLITQPDEEIRLEMFEMTSTALRQAGYEHYEISNFARPDSRSVHNQNYWQMGNYVGLGAGAHSFINPFRFQNPNSAIDYARRIEEGKLFRQNVTQPDPDVALMENLFMCLRMAEGLNLGEFEKRFGMDLRAGREERLHHLADEGLLTLTNDRLVLSREGWLRTDSILEYLL